MPRSSSSPSSFLSLSPLPALGRLFHAFRAFRISAPSPRSCSVISLCSQEQPTRITKNLRQNLRYLKLLKEFRKEKRPATSYRKKKREKESAFDDEENYDEATSELYFTNNDLERAQPVLLVDGYNVCGYWAKLKKFFQRGDLGLARQKLLEELVTFSVIKGVKVVVVFDAPLSGMQDRKEIYQGIDIVFASTTCADNWIEREVSLLLKDGCPQVWVATSDRVHQNCSLALGAFVWSCNVLISEIKDAKKESAEIRREKTSYSMQGKLLEDNLDPKVVETLKEWKKQLPWPEKRKRKTE